MTRREELLKELREARDAAMSPGAAEHERVRLEDAIVGWLKHVDMGKRIIEASAILIGAESSR